LPGVEGLSETVRVRSIVGRYLEHSRIFRFGNGKGAGEALHLIGSADLMPRNLDRRVEVLTPLAHPKHQAWVDKVLEFHLRDDVVRWELDRDGVWHRRGPEGFEPHPQHLLYEWVAARQTGRG
jgi:polyphosphate kinase